VTRIAIWSPNYAPELIGIPPLVTELAQDLVMAGHRVEVFTAMPNYPERRIQQAYRGRLAMTERRESVVIRRTWLRVRPNETSMDKVLYEATFVLCSAPLIAARLRHAEVLLCVVPSLAAATTAAAIRRLLGRRGPRLVLWWQDIVSLAAMSVGNASQKVRAGLVVLRGIEVAAARAADSIIVCSPGFRDYLVENGVNPGRLEVVLNWVDVGRFISDAAPRSPGPVRFLYTGNFGYTQGFETLLEATRLVGDTAAVRIVGGGNRENQIRELASGLGNVVIQEQVSPDAYPRLLREADVQVLLQRRISAGANLPSKIGPYLASARPVVASIDATTPAAELLRSSGGAILVEPEEPNSLAEAMRLLISDASLRVELGRRGRAFAEEHLDRGPATKRIEDLLLG
jgi:colanic acid biosynthesis glycosyl transferase WcaI